MKRVSGGVGRNIADALGRFGHDVCFLTAVGDDSNGRSIIKSLDHIVNIYYYYHPFVHFRVSIIARFNSTRYMSSRSNLGFFFFIEHGQDRRGRGSADVLVRGVP